MRCIKFEQKFRFYTALGVDGRLLLIKVINLDLSIRFDGPVVFLDDDVACCG